MYVIIYPAMSSCPEQQPYFTEKSRNRLPVQSFSYIHDKFADTNEVSRSVYRRTDDTIFPKKKIGKHTNNDLQIHTQKTIDSSTRTPQTIEGELGFSEQEGRPLLLH